MNEDLHILHRYLGDVLHTATDEALTQLATECRRHIGDDPDLLQLIADGEELGREILCLKTGGADASRSRRLAALSKAERAELEETQLVISENRFDYKFQPIVSTIDSEIYSYEALMRPRSELCHKPYHILKYAELTGRLSDIERATFINVLEMVDADKERFHGHKVFINSIPKTKLSLEDTRRIGELLMKHSDTVVVELTEQAEPDDDELNALKERYNNLGIPIAIDDYGTGYSNVTNLLRYMPNYVKIDRSLLSDLQDSPKKRHFVREIIEFCHENNILALAEGVETADELREVILLGADLIQGYYTARPASEPIESISDDIKRQIRHWRHERDDGRDQQIYTADVTERVRLDRLVKDDIRCLFIGKSGSADVTVIGSPLLDTNVHIETPKGFSGSITLENVRLSNIKNRPCIDIADECDVTLNLVGDSDLHMGGIHVPESSRLTVLGDGNLTIDLDSAEYYGIGNGIGLVHGELNFRQDGCITVNAHGQKGVAIGSGDGGKINIRAGQYKLNLSGDTGLGIGALYGDADLDIRTCDLNTDMTLSKGVAIGSIVNSCKVVISMTSLKAFMSGNELVGIGTIAGTNADVDLHDASTVFNIRGVRTSAIAAIDGDTKLTVARAGLRMRVGSDQSLAFGGLSGGIDVFLNNADTDIKLESSLDVSDYMSADKLNVYTGRYSFVLNGELITSNRD